MSAAVSTARNERCEPGRESRLAARSAGARAAGRQVRVRATRSKAGVRSCPGGDFSRPQPEHGQANQTRSASRGCAGTLRLARHGERDIGPAIEGSAGIVAAIRGGAARGGARNGRRSQRSTGIPWSRDAVPASHPGRRRQPRARLVSRGPAIHTSGELLSHGALSRTRALHRATAQVCKRWRCASRARQVRRLAAKAQHAPDPERPLRLAPDEPMRRAESKAMRRKGAPASRGATPRQDSFRRERASARNEAAAAATRRARSASRRNLRRAVAGAGRPSGGTREQRKTHQRAGGNQGEVASGVYAARDHCQTSPSPLIPPDRRSVSSAAPGRNPLRFTAAPSASRRSPRAQRFIPPARSSAGRRTSTQPPAAPAVRARGSFTRGKG